MSEINITNHNNFIDEHIGSDENLDEAYIKRQKRILDSKKNKLYISDDDASDSYDDGDEIRFGTAITDIDRIKSSEDKTKKKKTRKDNQEYDLFDNYRYKRGLMGNNHVTRYITD